MTPKREVICGDCGVELVRRPPGPGAVDPMYLPHECDLGDVLDYVERRRRDDECAEDLAVACGLTEPVEIDISKIKEIARNQPSRKDVTDMADFFMEFWDQDPGTKSEEDFKKWKEENGR